MGPKFRVSKRVTRARGHRVKRAIHSFIHSSKSSVLSLCLHIPIRNLFLSFRLSSQFDPLPVAFCKMWFPQLDFKYCDRPPSLSYHDIVRLKMEDPLSWSVGRSSLVTGTNVIGYTNYLTRRKNVQFTRCHKLHVSIPPTTSDKSEQQTQRWVH